MKDIKLGEGGGTKGKSLEEFTLKPAIPQHREEYH